MERPRVQDQWSTPDDLWDAFASLIPERVNTHPFGGGKPPTRDRVCLEQGRCDRWKRKRPVNPHRLGTPQALGLRAWGDDAHYHADQFA
jgi:hypothetical protein